MNPNEESQRDELLALTSIYESITTDFDTEDLNTDKPIKNPSGKLSIEIDLPNPFHVYTKTGTYVNLLLDFSNFLACMD